MANYSEFSIRHYIPPYVFLSPSTSVVIFENQNTSLVVMCLFENQKHNGVHYNTKQLIEVQLKRKLEHTLVLRCTALIFHHFPFTSLLLSCLSPLLSNLYNLSLQAFILLRFSRPPLSMLCVRRTEFKSTSLFL